MTAPVLAPPSDRRPGRSVIAEPSVEDAGDALALEGAPERLHCPGGHLELRLVGGLWCAESSPSEQRFLEGYCQVRRAEGWGSPDPEDLRALPFEDRTGRHPEIWRIRATSYRLLLGQLSQVSRRIVDLGAGNGWLALRLAARGHRVAAVDLLRDGLDGMSAGLSLPESRDVTWIQSSFDRVPLEPGSCDAAVFNGSLHYSTDPGRTLREARRLLSPRGRIVVLDSPLYRRVRSGERMIEERRQQWLAAGLEGAASSQGSASTPAADPLASDRRQSDRRPIGFLTRQRLDRWGQELGIQWRYYKLPLGWRWHLAPYVLPWIGRREPARFPVVVGRRREGEGSAADASKQEALASEGTTRR